MRREMSGYPDKEARGLDKKLQKLDRMRAGFLDLSAEGITSRDELKTKLAELEGQRKELEAALRSARDRQQTIEDAERAWHISGQLLELGHITFVTVSMEDRHRLYGPLRLRADVDREGTVYLGGIFDPEIRLFDVLQDPPDVTTPQVSGKRPDIVVASGNTPLPVPQRTLW